MSNLERKAVACHRVQKDSKEKKKIKISFLRRVPRVTLLIKQPRLKGWRPSFMRLGVPRNSGHLTPMAYVTDLGHFEYPT